MHISVILATYKRSEILSKTLESFCLVVAENLDWEVIVVDNAADKLTHDVIKNFSSSLPIKFLVETKQGKNYALNRALSKATGEIFIFTDDDIIPDKLWLMENWEGAKRWPDFAVFGGKILPKWPNGKNPFSFYHPFFKTAFSIADWDKPEGPYEYWRVWGPNMAVRGNIFKQNWRFNVRVGPSGNNYIPGSETDLVRRLYDEGFEPVYLPKSLVWHQIRSEQLSFKWLYRRAFRDGRRAAFEAGWKGSTNTWLQVPQYIIKSLIKSFIKHVFCRVIYKDDKKFHAAIQYWRTMGLFYQYRMMSKDDLFYRTDIDPKTN